MSKPEKVFKVVVPTGAPLLGNEKAKVQIIEFSDFACPYCSELAENLKKVKQRYGDKVALYYKHFPMDIACNPMLTRPFHQDACQAAKAAICAYDQGKFWEMHDILFSNQQAQTAKDLENYAGQLQLDLDRFRSCMRSEEAKKRLKQDIDDGLKLNFRGTPVFYINGQQFQGAYPVETLEEIISEILKG